MTDVPKDKSSNAWLSSLSVKQRNTVGTVCSMVAGLCYGVMFSPVQSLINDKSDEPGYSGDMIDYVFAVYNGIFVSALLYFVVYAVHKKNRPFVNTQAVFPSIVGGVLWALAMTAYFVALDKHNLGVETTFPIMSAGPQIISSLWGVLYYKEIKGRRNLTFLGGALACSLMSVLTVSLSKFDL